MRIYEVNKEYTVDLKRIVSIHISRHSEDEDGNRTDESGWFEIILDTDQILDIGGKTEEINKLYEDLIEAWKAYVEDEDTRTVVTSSTSSSRRRCRHL